MIVDPIFLAGPSITRREIEYVTTAGAVGWNLRGAEFIRAFERRLAARVGRPHALATANCTGAMHLALTALGIGRGDEILVPEIADISVAAAVLYTGAAPVFCDVDPLSLCLTPATAEARITPATKGILAVHQYSGLCDMPALEALAERRGLFLLENTAQALGGAINGRPVGGFGDISVCSFNEADTPTCGEGGMLLASDPELFHRALKPALHGRGEGNPFIYEQLGFDYAMSNLQAALGLAQVERLDELTAQKRRVFSWYRERLERVPGVWTTPGQPGVDNPHIMTALFFEDASMLRHTLLQRLAASGIICRPVHYPLSSMPMFTKADNPAAYGPALRALLLPSGHNRTEEEIDHVVATIAALTAEPALPSVRLRPTGTLAYKSDVLSRIAKAKSDGLRVPFAHDGRKYALRAVTAADAANPETVSLLAQWRRENSRVFLWHFTADDAFIRGTLRNYLERAREHLLFFIAEGDELFGQIGLDDFNFSKRECVLETLILRPSPPKGLGAAACEALFAFAREHLDVRRLYNHMLASNTKVRLLASAQGFSEVNRTPLCKEETADGVVFHPIYVLGHDKPDDHLVVTAKDL